jgi:alkanesulfonate monooxygenase SsuD/methylene tetrahydromethanopterin reductase-like flavin-dependent oxidoreductase (luciferase family)
MGRSPNLPAMQFGFFFWPFDPPLVGQMATAAERGHWDMLGIADTPGNAMDPWVAATLAAQATPHARIALCVTNLTSRHPAVTAAAAASLDLVAPGRTVLGIGAGHSGTRNLGIGGSGVGDLEAGLGFIRRLLSGEPGRWHDGAEARLPWVRQPPKLFVAASGPRTLALAGRAADGVFVNFGLMPDNLAQSTGAIAAAASAAGRDPAAIEVWQVAALDCSHDGSAARERLGGILAFMAAGYILGSGDLGARGVPAQFHRPLLELRRRYSTRPGPADAALVRELGLFDYLAERFAIHGTPAECRAQLLRAREAGVERVMFTVSLAADPAAAVALFGEEVMPAFR